MTDQSGNMRPHTSDTFAGWLVLVLTFLVWSAYLALALRRGRRGRPWPGWRLASFTAGMALVATALGPPAMGLAHEDLRWHMAQHLVLGMVAPLGLVLAAAPTLLLRNLPAGAARIVVRLLRRRSMHVLTHPVTALALNVGGMYVLYLTPRFAWTLEHSGLHWLILVHFLAAGSLFTWAIVGPDPAPRRPGIAARTAVLILSLGLHATLGKLMYAYLLPRDVPYDPDQVREAAELMYYGGDIAEVLLAIVLFGGWYRQRQRHREPTPSSSMLSSVRPLTRR